MKVKDLIQVIKFKKQFHQYYKSEGVSGTFSGTDGLILHYTKFTHPDNTKAIIISPGRGEAGIKYAELLYDLRGYGYDVWILDHRGQGFSQRVLKDPYKGHVNEFEDYVLDFEEFSLIVDQEKEYAKKILLAHSMGAAIGLLFSAAKPNYFDGAILSSPMFDIKLNGMPKFFALALLYILRFFGKARDWVINGGHHLEVKGFDENTVTSSHKRFLWERFIESKHPKIRSGFVTNNWVLEAINATDRLYEKRKNIKIPILMFQAGKEFYVNPGRQKEFCDHLENYTLVRIEDALHEVLHEQDNIRNVVMKEIGKFLKGV